MGRPPEEAEVRKLAEREAWIQLRRDGRVSDVGTELATSWLAQGRVIEAARRRIELMRRMAERGVGEDTTETEALATIAVFAKKSLAALAAGGETETPPGVERIFGSCSEHGEYELPLASVERGDVERRCPACGPSLLAERPR